MKLLEEIGFITFLNVKIKNKGKNIESYLIKQCSHQRVKLIFFYSSV